MNAPQLTDISQYIGNILLALIPIIGFLVFLMILYGGFTILTSSGNKENIEKGKKMITYAVTGIVMAILSWLSLVLINRITGANVLNFSITF